MSKHTQDTAGRKPAILTKAQAEAVYSAICALNNVAGQLGETEMRNADGSYVSVRETSTGMVRVNSATASERYADQTAFATAYGLDHGGEPQSAVAAAAGGITQVAIER